MYNQTMTGLADKLVIHSATRFLENVTTLKLTRTLLLQVSILLKDSFIDSFQSRDQPFIKVILTKAFLNFLVSGGGFG
mgnify:CR=1 FL=1